MNQSKLRENAKIGGFVAFVVIGVAWLLVVAMNSGNSADDCKGDDPAFWCELGN